ncbi:MAG TPA: protein-L-isoaspartate O-methyltransferase [Steroidobacteraceae bacterium]|jgi:protein-L-isoaspartate(D-aspartate) O-methyltransferase|nr:protein-L-isoaspartate O-methyltransferase [Steroidobacteraceae bacterium]
MLVNEAREQMIEQQVRAWEVLDARVLEVLRIVPREQFVPERHRFLAFADVEVPLPHGQHMLRPNVVGRLLQSLELTGTERVLEIGAGTGFVTACLAAASAHVKSLEIFADLADQARANLAAVGARNVEVLTADALQAGVQLEPSDAGTRYHAIAVTGSLPVYDERFQRLLEVGGRLFVIVGDAPVMEARLVRRVAEDAWSTESLFETVVDPLINARRPPRFAF